MDSYLGRFSVIAQRQFSIREYGGGGGRQLVRVHSE